MRSIKHILVFIAIFAFMPTAYCGTRDSLRHALSLQIGGGYNLTGHYYYKGSNPDNRRLNKHLAFNLRYSFAFNPQTTIGQDYPTAYQGIGVATHTFFAHRSLGTPLAVYLFQGGRILDFSKSIGVGYEWNFGISWGWVANDATRSTCNAMINISLPFTWQIGSGWEMSLAPTYTHFSNGDTAFPNSGIDSYGVKLGVTKRFDNIKERAAGRKYISSHPSLRDKHFWERVSWDVLVYGGWRADRFMSNGKFCLINKPFPNWGAQINPLYHFNQYFSLGASIDIFTDTSANLYDATFDPATGEVSGYSKPSLWEQTAVALSVRGEIRMPFCSVGVGIGSNIIQHGYDMKRLYSVFGLKIFVIKDAFIYVGYRLSTLKYTRNIMYGFGYRF